MRTLASLRPTFEACQSIKEVQMREGRSRRVRVYALAGALAVFALAASSATAVTPPKAPSALVSVSPGPGTGPPPATLGGFFMTPFPPDAQGRWTVDVVTASGQLIGRLRFRVDG